ncbi:exodeoxyribonuclease III [Oceanomicrobium pacificus]|uniref:Exodeoxyribonuclease III n=1 Tax=Oceanomicrobium pacificus TaxID=2692916 RepID=A0A6B0TUH6_9RHOB|nr:exodeoxyribonuclease III [Oceanomicrobium pacificus]MXU64824.1 exodeoxyribonuclease III [Oceanomicrobium pacificus]
MTLTVCTWNINSVRLREPIVLDLLARETPDVLCLQEIKSPVEKIPTEAFTELGYGHMVARGQKAYNGVAILSRLPLEDVTDHAFCREDHARHVAAKLPGGTEIHNFYVPAGGDVPDPVENPKFAHKLDFLDRMADWGRTAKPQRSILVGDLNIAPREDDVWSHKQLLKIVSHTPIEVERLTATQNAGNWVDVTRQDIPEGLLYSWWSYRARDWDAADKGRRLDHIWATPDLAARSTGQSRVARDVRGWEKPSDHAPVFASFDIDP